MHDPFRRGFVPVLAALALAGCADHGAGNGRTPLAALGEGAVTSRVRVVPAARLDRRGRACVAGFRREFDVLPWTIVVERMGVLGASVTFTDAHRRVVLGCDRTRPGSGGSWWARSVGRLIDGRLRDPRVDIVTTARGGAVGFAWIEPSPRTHWIVVARSSGAEVEEVAAGLPVRVATLEVDRAASSATFEVVEYDAADTEVARNRLEARVAG